MFNFIIKPPHRFVCRTTLILLLGYSQLAFSEYCDVPLINLGKNLSCQERWDLYVFLKKAQPIFNIQLASLTIKVEGIESDLQLRQNLVDAVFASGEMLVAGVGGLPPSTVTLRDAGLTAGTITASILYESAPDISRVPPPVVDAALCVASIILDHNPKDFYKVYPTAILCGGGQLASMTLNFIAAIGLDKAAEDFNSITIASQYLLDCYRSGGSCTRNINETAEQLGFKNRLWNDDYNESDVRRHIDAARSIVSKTTKMCMERGCIARADPAITPPEQTNTIPPPVVKKPTDTATPTVPSTPPIGPKPQPIPGKKTDIRPDFDVFSDKGKDHEISANCDECSGKSVSPRQRIYSQLTAQAANASADKFKRKSSRKKLKGSIW